MTTASPRTPRIQNLMDNLETRVIALEYKAGAHDKELQFLRATGDTLKSSLDGVKATLNQIKYTLMGALGAFVAAQAGLLKGLKVMFGIG